MPSIDYEFSFPYPAPAGGVICDMEAVAEVRGTVGRFDVIPSGVRVEAQKLCPLTRQWSKTFWTAPDDHLRDLIVDYLDRTPSQWDRINERLSEAENDERGRRARAAE